MKKPRPLIRDSETFRDASLVVIASEDTYAVKRYFGLFRTKRVQFRILETTGGRSSPLDLLRRMDLYCKEFQIGGDDQLWICLDTDHWADSSHISNLTLLAQECQNKDIRLAFSNPCFETWILMHYSDIDTSIENCDAVVKQLKNQTTGYRKNSSNNLSIDEEMVRRAIDYAKTLWPRTRSDWFHDRPGSGVYRLVEFLIEKEQIQFRD